MLRIVELKTNNEGIFGFSLAWKRVEKIEVKAFSIINKLSKTEVIINETLYWSGTYAFPNIIPAAGTEKNAKIIVAGTAMNKVYLTAFLNPDSRRPFSNWVKTGNKTAPKLTIATAALIKLIKLL